MLDDADEDLLDRLPVPRVAHHQGHVVVEVEGKRYAGQAVAIDVLEASAKAYVRAVNNAAAAGEV